MQSQLTKECNLTNGQLEQIVRNFEQVEDDDDKHHIKDAFTRLKDVLRECAVSEDSNVIGLMHTRAYVSNNSVAGLLVDATASLDDIITSGGTLIAKSGQHRGHYGLDLVIVLPALFRSVFGVSAVCNRWHSLKLNTCATRMTAHLKLR